MQIDDLETPAVVVDLGILDRGDFPSIEQPHPIDECGSSSRTFDQL